MHTKTGGMKRKTEMHKEKDAVGKEKALHGGAEGVCHIINR